MAQQLDQLRTRVSVGLRYVVAVLSVAIALELALLLRTFRLEDVLILMAIAITGWYGGIGPGLLAVALGVLGLDYFFIAHNHHFEISNEIDFVVFTAFALVINWLSISRHKVEASLREARNQLETRVAERTAELQAILDASPVGIALLRQDQTVLRCNPAFERIFGWHPDYICGRTIPVPESRRAEWHSCVANLARGKSFLNLQTQRIRKDGSEFYASISGAPLRSESGVIVGSVSTIVDVTEQRRAEDALRQAQADLEHINRVTTMGELTASLAHEVKQPLAAAVTNAEACLRLLEGGRPDISEVREAASGMLGSTRRAAEIIDRVRSLFRKGTPQWDVVDVNEVIREIAVLLQNETRRHSVDVHMELAENLPRVMGDRVQLQQVLMNLMLNGIEAMRGNTGELRITSQAKEGRVLISVSDTGVGLPNEKMDHIFNAFVTTKPQGTGMGLAISRSIVESHGGRLWATPNPERGATFCFTLPHDVPERR